MFTKDKNIGTVLLPTVLLLRQKVSRLGLSTHMENALAILNLESPKNTHNLQIFLGMMVYFLAYIPLVLPQSDRCFLRKLNYQAREIS